VLQGDHPVQGTSRKRPVGLRLGFSSDDFGYAIDLGLPALLVLNEPETRLR
jgi:hypothetical protein